MEREILDKLQLLHGIGLCEGEEFGTLKARKDNEVLHENSLAVRFSRNSTTSVKQTNYQIIIICKTNQLD